MEGEGEWDGEVDAGLTKRSRRSRAEKVGEGAEMADSGAEVTVDSERSVYLDEPEGSWKCRRCTWIYQMENPGINSIQNHRENSHGGAGSNDVTAENSFTTVSFSGGEVSDDSGVDFEKDLGIQNGSMIRETGKGHSDKAEIQPVSNLTCSKDSSEIETEKPEALQKATAPNKLSTVNGLASEAGEKKGDLKIQNGFQIVENEQKPNQTESQSAAIHLHSGDCREIEIEKPEPVINVGEEHFSDQKCYETKQAVTEIDLEKVLEEQETHDLFCPNCHSCITKRVILRRRKRISQDIKNDQKRPKVSSQTESHAEAAELPLPEQSQEPDVFRCLSCLSFFIATASGFRLFKVFKRREEDVTLQTAASTAAPNSQLVRPSSQPVNDRRPGGEIPGVQAGTGFPLSSEPNIGRGELAAAKALKKGTDALLMSGSVVGALGGSYPSDYGSRTEQKCTGLPLQLQHKLFEASAGNGAIPSGGEDDINWLSPSANQSGNLSAKKNDTFSSSPESQIEENFPKDAKPPVKCLGENLGKHKQDVAPSLGTDAWHFGKVQTNLGDKIEYQPGMMTEGNISVKFVESSLTISNQTTVVEKNPLLEEVALGKGKIHSENGDKYVFISNSEALLSVESVNGKHIAVNLPSDNYKGIVEQGILKPTTESLSESGENLPISANPGVATERQTQIDIGAARAVRSGSREWDILKSIVYGGLVESITSLGVVSSAAGSDATTLNIVVLALANLLGGLIVLTHNLRELISDQYETIDPTMEERDKYYRTLGRRENFRRHIIVAVLSYIIFGILPPIIYGFSFRKSDNHDYKLLAVAGASLLCIFLLSIGKAHVQRAPKSYIKTIMYYVSIGITSSGLAYAAGEFVKGLLEKTGWFNSNATGDAPSLSAAILGGWAGSRTPGWASSR